MPFQIQKNPKAVQIMATGEGWQLSPVETERIIYCLNDFIAVNKYQVQPDLLFIMDILDEKPKIVDGSDNLGAVIKRINDMRVPLVAPFAYEEIPLSQSFPLEKCVKEFGMPYFTNTICYMIAYALLNFVQQEQLEGRDGKRLDAYEIHIYGVNQAGSHEYQEERGGVEYWIGVANGRGVKVVINGKDSQLMKYKGRYGNNILYGYLSTYEEYKAHKAKFGSMIRQLSAPPKQLSRIVRKVYDTTSRTI